MKLEEVDQVSNPADHLGDYRPEMGDPYPATREAQARSTVTLPGEAHRDPDEVREDFARYGAQPSRLGTLTRELAATDWNANGHILADGVQGFVIADEDQQRVSLTVWNHADGGVFIAPTPTRSLGFGALYIPGRDLVSGVVHSRTLRCTGKVYVFTLAGFIAGSEPVHVQTYMERWG